VNAAARGFVLKNITYLDIKCKCLNGRAEGTGKLWVLNNLRVIDRRKQGMLTEGSSVRYTSSLKSK
jgi:hypothetical protein